MAEMRNFIETELAGLAEKLGPVADKLEGTTVLINGAGGFVGNYLVGILQHLNKTRFKKKVKIIALDNFITGLKHSPFFDLKDKHLTFLKHDVRKPFKTKGRIDYILHAAGIASPVYYAKYPLETIATSVDGLKHTLELARAKKVKGVAYFSSSEIYGDPHPEFIPTPEDYRGYVSSTGLRACYDESKRLGETLSTIYHRMYGVPVTIIRPFNVYGPGMKINDQRVLPNFLNAALDGKPLQIHEGGKHTRTFSYATDAADGFFRVLLLGRPGEAYNIGTDFDEISVHDLAKKVQVAHGTKVNIALIKYPEGYPIGDPTRRAPDLAKARKELRFNPAITLDDGLPRMFTWYKLLRAQHANQTAKRQVKHPRKK